MSGLLYESAHNSAYLANPTSIPSPCQVPQGRNNQEPGTEVPGIRYKTDESRLGRHKSDIRCLLHPESKPLQSMQPRESRFGAMVFCAVPIGTRSLCQAHPALPCRALDCYVPSGLDAVVRWRLDSPGRRCFVLIRGAIHSFFSYDNRLRVSGSRFAVPSRYIERGQPQPR
jgi:hypothetical protein